MQSSPKPAGEKKRLPGLRRQETAKSSASVSDRDFFEGHGLNPTSPLPLCQPT